MQQIQKYKKAELGEIPEEWTVKRFSDIGDVIGGGTPDTTKKDYWENGNIAWAVPTDLTGLNKNYIDKTERYITEKGLNNSAAKLLPVGTVLITSRATIGQCTITKIPITTNQGFQSIICNNENDNIFILYTIKFNKEKLVRKSHGTTFLEISKNNIKNLKVPIPPIKEQQKIASILSNIDSQIQKQQEYRIKLETLKKGLMQQLLTGKIRVRV
ncbi:MAG: restriction endonuclease subunit S [Nitrososphaeraceae archaeon]